MCKDMNETKKSTKSIRIETARESTRRLVALAALTRLDEHAKGIAQIRKTLETAREQHERCSLELAATERLVEQMEDLIMDEVMAIAGLEDDGDDGDCGCAGDTQDDDDLRSLGFDDEQGDRAQSGQPEPAAKAPAPALGRRPALAPLVFGALGVACAVASLVTRSLTDERKE